MYYRQKNVSAYLLSALMSRISAYTPPAACRDAAFEIKHGPSKLLGILLNPASYDMRQRPNAAPTSAGSATNYLPDTVNMQIALIGVTR